MQLELTRGSTANTIIEQLMGRRAELSNTTVTLTSVSGATFSGTPDTLTGDWLTLTYEGMTYEGGIRPRMVKRFSYVFVPQIIGVSFETKMEPKKAKVAKKKKK